LEKLRLDCYRYYIEECQKSAKYVIDLRQQRDTANKKNKKSISCTSKLAWKAQEFFSKLFPAEPQENFDIF